HQSYVVGSRNLDGLGHLPGISNDIETPFDKLFHNSRTDPLRSSGHDGCLPWAAHGCLPPHAVIAAIKNATIAPKIESNNPDLRVSESNSWNSLAAFWLSFDMDLATHTSAWSMASILLSIWASMSESGPGTTAPFLMSGSISFS